MTVREFLRNTRSYDRYFIRPPVKCADGFFISIQASESHYCSPKTTGLEEYVTVELGFPSDKDDLIMEFAEDTENPTGTVYAEVPVDIVEELMQRHGGIVGTTTWEAEQKNLW